MISQKKQGLQEMFLSALQNDGQEVSVFLQRGVQLKGKIKCFDDASIMLEDDTGHSLLIYKHAVTTVSPSKNLPDSWQKETQ